MARSRPFLDGLLVVLSLRFRNRRWERIAEFYGEGILPQPVRALGPWMDFDMKQGLADVFRIPRGNLLDSFFVTGFW